MHLLPTRTTPSPFQQGRADRPEGGVTSRPELRHGVLRLIPCCVALALAACVADQPRTAAPPVAAQPQLVQVWESPAGEFPAICMLLNTDGSMRFRGGFAFYNPSTWKTGATAQQIIISLGGDAEFPVMATAQELRKGSSSLIRADARQREMEFRLNSKNESIAFGGFYFYRKPTCSAV